MNMNNDAQLELGTWLRRALRGLKEKGIVEPNHGDDKTGLYNIGEIFRLVQTHGIEISREGTANEAGLIVGE